MIVAGHDLLLLAHFKDAAGGEDAAESCARVNDAITSQNAPRVDDGVAAHFRAVSDDGAELGQARRDISLLRADRDFAVIEFHIGKNGPPRRDAPYNREWSRPRN